MSNLLIGVREHDIPPQAVLEKMLSEAMGLGESREALFGQGNAVMTKVLPRHDAGFFLCYDGVIRPKAFDGMIPDIVSQPDLLRETAQDAMRIMLRDHGIVVKLHGSDMPAAGDKNDDGETIFFKVSCDDVWESGCGKVSASVLKWLSTKQENRNAVVVDDIMIEPVSRISKNVIRFHSSAGESEELVGLYSACSLYGSGLHVMGMSDDFREFWHLNYLLASLGAEMELKRTSSEADVTMKMAVDMSHILSA